MAKESDLLSKFQQVPVQKEMELGDLFTSFIASILGNDISLTFILIILSIFVIVLFLSRL